MAVGRATLGGSVFNPCVYFTFQPADCLIPQCERLGEIGIVAAVFGIEFRPNQGFGNTAFMAYFIYS